MGIIDWIYRWFEEGEPKSAKKLGGAIEKLDSMGVEPEKQREVNSVIETILEEYVEETKQPAINLKAKRGKNTVYSSKFGGTPYLPQGFAYPVSRNPNSGGAPLRLLAQLNFAELPKLPAFPEEGILQFYVDADDVYGMDFDNYTNQAGFRVVYHQQVELDESKLQAPPEATLAEGEVYMPFEGEFVLEAELVEMPMSATDFRAGEKFMEVYRRHKAIDGNGIYDLEDEERDLVWDRCSGSGHRIGGYPFFTQDDPRYQKVYRDHTVLLFQMDSDMIDKKYEIIWGDSGVCGFFITPEALSNLDFSNVVYNWDCY